ncbi:DeoR family transcriptional regulator [Pokkaliibacter plantistimulans]|uniref:DeoR family transcriptional regulator n=1 Tax=Proteobacteria bacterium 228 TaxID=2083153 RepID=A0A2S5KMZ7_9PROT|nr:DeoR/GlpR family DNA-binding transcription regulator [Pokkaliibacter plantistimulans]PPC76033.1 DeoR family transcriptional regulator [Pokkaliibacter plantistimulans]
MLTKQRKQHILNTLQQQGNVVAKTLSQELGVSEDTIRRDLRELAKAGVLQRVHGGALPASPAVVDLTGRQQLSSDEKALLGKAAATLIEPDQVVFVDGGTSTLQLVRALPADLRATIVTHSPVIAAELISHPAIQVVLIGGQLFKHSGVAVGAAALAAIRSIRADTYFLGVTGIHADYGLSTGDLEEAQIKRALIEQAAETVLMATADKVGKVSPYVIASATAVSQLLVTRSTAPAQYQPLADLGIAVSLCE